VHECVGWGGGGAEKRQVDQRWEGKRTEKKKDGAARVNGGEGDGIRIGRRKGMERERGGQEEMEGEKR
jgi:hypothetical protein